MLSHERRGSEFGRCGRVESGQSGTEAGRQATGLLERPREMQVDQSPQRRHPRGGYCSG